MRYRQSLFAVAVKWIFLGPGEFSSGAIVSALQSSFERR
jgi:hypothetical protein